MARRIEYSPNLGPDENPVVIRLFQKQMVNKAGGGLAQAADQVQGAGRDGDEILLHINPVEYEWLKQQWGDPHTNPETGLPEYGFFSKLFKNVKNAASADMTPWKYKNLLHQQKNMVKNYGAYAAMVASIVFPALAPAVGAWMSAGALSGAAAGALGSAAMGAAVGGVANGGKGALAGAVTGGIGGAAGQVGSALGAGAADSAGAKILGNAIAGGAGAGVSGGDIGKGALTGAAIAAASPIISNAVHGGDLSVNGVEGGGAQKTVLPDSYNGLGSEGAAQTYDNLGTSLSGSDPTPGGMGSNPQLNTSLSDYGNVVDTSSLPPGTSLDNAQLSDMQGGSSATDAGVEHAIANAERTAPVSQGGGGQKAAPGTAGSTDNSIMATAKKYAPLLLAAQSAGAGSQANASNNMPDMTMTLPQIDFKRTPNQQGVNYYTYGQGPEHSFFNENALPGVSDKKARGGLEQSGGPPMGGSQPGELVRGPGTGRSDDIPAQLSDGEYVMDAETVNMLGDGSTDEGARRLDQLRNNLRQHKGQALSKGKFSPNAKSPEQYLGKGPKPKAKPKAKGKGKPVTFQEPVGAEDDSEGA